MFTKLRIESKPKATQRGFGLVELVVTVAILGILSAIAIPGLLGYTEEANVRRCQRIAQEFAMVANSAAAAGNTQIAEASGVAEAIELISNGLTGTELFADTRFALPGVSPADRNEAAHHLTLSDGVLYFDPVEPH